jgi:hypothetical protein
MWSIASKGHTGFDPRVGWTGGIGMSRSRFVGKPKILQRTRSDVSIDVRFLVNHPKENPENPERIMDPTPRIVFIRGP